MRTISSAVASGVALEQFIARASAGLRELDPQARLLSVRLGPLLYDYFASRFRNLTAVDLHIYNVKIERGPECCPACGHEEGT